MWYLRYLRSLIQTLKIWPISPQFGHQVGILNNYWPQFEELKLWIHQQKVQIKPLEKSGLKLFWQICNGNAKKTLPYIAKMICRQRQNRLTIGSPDLENVGVSDVQKRTDSTESTASMQKNVQVVSKSYKSYK